MKAFLISFILFSSNSFAWEWSNKAFNESMQKYKNTAKQWIDNPHEIGNSIKQRYEPVVYEMSSALKKKASTMESTEAYLIFRNAGQTLSKYGGVSSQDQFFRYLSQDTKEGALWIYHNYEKAPIIGPFKRELDSRYDHLYYQSIFFTPIIQREYQKYKYKFIP